MNTNNVTRPDGPEIQISLLLTFLIEKFTDALTNDPPEVPLLLQGLGYPALSSNEELRANYTGLLAAPHLPPKEIVRRSVEIFETALRNDPDGRAIQQSRETGKAPDVSVTRQFLMTALREGKIMEKDPITDSSVFSSYSRGLVFSVITSGWLSSRRSVLLIEMTQEIWSGGGGTFS